MESLTFAFKVVIALFKGTLLVGDKLGGTLADQAEKRMQADPEKQILQNKQTPDMGGQVGSITCAHCRFENESDASLCINCGQELVAPQVYTQASISESAFAPLIPILAKIGTIVAVCGVCRLLLEAM